MMSPIAEAQTVNPPESEREEQGIADIIVTAERRKSSVQDTPIAISAFDGARLESQGIVSVEGLSRIAPSLQIYSEQINNEEYIIRGIGKSNEDLTTDSGVAVNINDAYIPQSGEANAALFDIERVEVLRGPQGTLYGKNAVGGVINIITRKPTDHLDGYVLAELGGLGRRQFEAAVGAPVVEDKLSARIAGFSLHTDGAYRNLTTGRRANGIDSQALRGSVRFTPNEDWEINLVADYSKVDQHGVLKSIIADVPGTPLIVRDFLEGPYPTQEKDIRSGRSETEGEQGIRQWGGVLRVDRKADAGTISFLSAYRSERSYNVEDVDRTAALQNNFSATQKTWATSQELRFVSDDAGPLSAGGKLHWSGGLYWFHEQGRRDQQIFLHGCTPGSQPCDAGKPDDPDDGILGPGSPDYQNSTTSFLQRVNTDSFAAFGEIKYDIADRLSATAGLRYTSENKSFDLDATSVANVPGGDPFSLFMPDGDFRASRSKTWHSLTPKFVLEFAPNGNIHTYASYARGFKSGGFNGQAGTAADTEAFNPEVADNFEVGVKADLLDRRLRLNAAAFYIKFNDLQVSGVNQQGLIITNNAADARIKGFELEGWAQPLPGLNINGSLSLLDATFRNYAIEAFDPSITDGPPFYILDLNGKRLPNIPRYTATLGAQYEHRFGNGSKVRIGADGTFKGNTLTNELTLRANSYTVVDARIGWTSANGRWDFSGWIRNLTNEVYYTGGGAIPDYNKTTTRVGLVADPRTAGVTVKLLFGE
ncbi:MAG: TonB-dependent receptor [Candidatus Sphingomonas phytovorans]|nr:TonB-dependent receptor [Sphingomonas sp.]WEK02321.1 MAG: TonB-dependent receptor [Sphingomonas sp.]